MPYQIRKAHNKKCYTVKNKRSKKIYAKKESNKAGKAITYG